MANLLLLTDGQSIPAQVLPALELLPHRTTVARALAHTARADVILPDARRALVRTRTLCRLITSGSARPPLLAIASEGALAAMSADWGFDDLLLDTARPAEVHLRLRLALSRVVTTLRDPLIRAGQLVIDFTGSSAELHGNRLPLTYTEFALLKHLAQHPGRAFSRHQLLTDVWGYNFYAGTRTVDVHIRRLRAKLGPGHESLIATVRNVGYRFLIPTADTAHVTATQAQGPPRQHRPGYQEPAPLSNA